MNDFTYKFAATRAVQSNQLFYQATIPFRVLASLLKIDDEFDPLNRSQRRVNLGRARKVTKYIQSNINSFYVIPPLVGFIQGECSFAEVPLDGFSNIGHLHVPIESRLMLFDGQHRAYGIRELLTKVPEARHENVSVMLYQSLNLSERQQGFHDINFNGSKPAKALCIAYNGRDTFEKMVIEAVQESRLSNYIEYEQNAVGGSNKKVWSLKAVLDMARIIFNSEVTEGSKEVFTEYLDVLVESTPILSALIFPERDPKDYRRDYICGHSVSAVALGFVGKALLSTSPASWKDMLDKLNDSKLWYRDSGQFEGRLEVNGKMKSSRIAAELTAYKLLELCDYELCSTQKNREHSLISKIEMAQS